MKQIKYNEKTDRWIYDTHRSLGYSCKKYGPLAKLLAEKSFKTGKRYKNYILKSLYHDYYIMYIFSKQTNSIHKVFIDGCDYRKIKDIKWFINVPSNSRTLYVQSDKYGKLHRFILDISNKSIIIDHINRNGLDNRRCNLRETDTSINKRNMNTINSNKFKQNGIYYLKASTKNNECIVATWMESKYKQKKKKFYIYNYNSFEECLNDAIKYRKRKEIEFNYHI